MDEQEQNRRWKQIHQLMFDYLKHLGYDDTDVEEFKKRCLNANYPYFKPLEDWIFRPTSFPNSSSGEVCLGEEFGKVTSNEATGAPLASSSVTAVDIPHELVDPDNFPNRSSGTVRDGKVNTIDPTKINIPDSGEVCLGEEFGKVTSNETTGAPIVSSSVSAVDIPHELVDPDNFPNRSSGTVRDGKVNTIDPTKINTPDSGEVCLGEEFGKVTSNETTGAPIVSSSVSAVDIPHELVNPDNFPDRSSGTVRYGKVNAIDPTKINTPESGEVCLGEEFGKVTSNETTGAPIASSSTTTVDIPHELTDPDNFPNKSRRTGEANLSEEFGQVTSSEATGAPLDFPLDLPFDFPLDFPVHIPFDIPDELLDPEQAHRFGELLGSPPRPSDPSQ